MRGADPDLLDLGVGLVGRRAASLMPALRESQFVFHTIRHCAILSTAISYRRWKKSQVEIELASRDSRKNFPLGLAANPRGSDRRLRTPGAVQLEGCRVPINPRRRPASVGLTAVHLWTPANLDNHPNLKMGVMRRNMVVAKTLFFLVVAGCCCPAAICVVVALAALLHVMGIRRAARPCVISLWQAECFGSSIWWLSCSCRRSRRCSARRGRQVGLVCWKRLTDGHSGRSNVSSTHSSGADLPVASADGEDEVARPGPSGHSLDDPCRRTKSFFPAGCSISRRCFTC